ncbi:MAG TPA: 4-hydroxyphenylpyruvate dioxygenase [Phycisphaerae bacterium]|nr:4-hydroxyphenylpyruvate dioxygenase [Phycisphaerales bacterium]HRX85936.1 4-hydroxyphenylpyruvate dioxygenase [Phycisphaerae bacterium]
MASEKVPLEAIDHLEFFVGNAYQAAHFYRTMFGFNIVAYSGLTTGRRDQASYVVEQGKIRFVLTTPLSPDSPIARFCALHGDGVKSVAFRVKDVEATLNAVRANGATVIAPMSTWKDEQGELRFAAIRTYGDVIHTFVDRTDYGGVFAPRYVPFEAPRVEPSGLLTVDHVVGNVELGAMEYWARFYHDVLGFSQLKHFTDDDISTEYSALMSKVMQSDNGVIKFPINEPAEGRHKSQIEEYLDCNFGPGVQHVALSTGNIVKTVTRLRDAGVEFLYVPDTYYDALVERVGDIKEDMDTLRDLGILVDRDEDGYLLQIFTKPVEDRPTLFFEIIQRCGSRGFGVGNFKALFVSIEEEQRRRGNL